MKETSCDVVQDLLPLYLDGCCHPGSRELVEGHLKECPDCERARREMAGELPAPEESRPEQPVGVNLVPGDTSFETGIGGWIYYYAPEALDVCRTDGAFGTNCLELKGGAKRSPG